MGKGGGDDGDDEKWFDSGYKVRVSRLSGLVGCKVWMLAVHSLYLHKISVDGFSSRIYLDNVWTREGD